MKTITRSTLEMSAMVALLQLPAHWLLRRNIDLISSLPIALCTGLFFFLLMTGLNYLGVMVRKNHGRENLPHPMRQSQILVIDAPLASIQKDIKLAFSEISRVGTIKELDGISKTTVGLGWKSLGEHLEINLEPLSQTETKLTMSSSPILWTNGFDWGKNLENINRVFGYYKAKYSVKEGRV